MRLEARRFVARDVHHAEVGAVEAHQAAERGEPQLAVGQGDDVVDRVLGQAFGGRPPGDAVILRAVILGACHRTTADPHGHQQTRAGGAIATRRRARVIER